MKEKTTKKRINRLCYLTDRVVMSLHCFYAMYAAVFSVRPVSMYILAYTNRLVSRYRGARVPYAYCEGVSTHDFLDSVAVFG